MKSFISNIMQSLVSKIVIVGTLLLTSCIKQEGSAMYQISTSQHDDLHISLTDWNVCGSFTIEEDSLLKDSFLVNPHHFMNLYKADTAQIKKYSGLYHPLYNQLDLKEVFHVQPDDTTHILQDKITYLHCEIISDADVLAYVEVKTSMECVQFLNADTLRRRDIQGLNIYPFHLKKGHNDYIVKTKCTGNDYSFESTIYDSISVAKLYADGQSCNIIYPEIDSLSHIVMLTNAHQNVVDLPVTLQFYDVYGDSLCNRIVVQPDSFTYFVDGMENNKSYICEMTIGDHAVRQPVLCGKDDNAYARFVEMRKQLPDNHPRVAEIDQVLYRLNFLLNHPTRYDGDWWWQFKISPLTYQLEHTFAHLDSTYGEDDSEANIQFITYQSEIDDSLQRYILARPNKIDRSKRLPLVVVIRPNIENLHHFFACPQLARQWAVNQMQSLSNKYGFLIMMPEIRTYLNEDLLPIAEEELKLAIKDVQKHYPVDLARLFLHANCSGGYRALRMATDYPEMFKAIALYAPVYHRDFEDKWSNEHKPELSIKNLKRTPMLIHGDPIDTHSPCSLYKDLIEDCQKRDIPLTLSIKRNSGQFYNVVLVGEEALDFFSKQK